MKNVSFKSCVKPEGTVCLILRVLYLARTQNDYNDYITSFASFTGLQSSRFEAIFCELQLFASAFICSCNCKGSIPSSISSSEDPEVSESISSNSSRAFFLPLSQPLPPSLPLPPALAPAHLCALCSCISSMSPRAWPCPWHPWCPAANTPGALPLSLPSLGVQLLLGPQSPQLHLSSHAPDGWAAARVAGEPTPKASVRGLLKPWPANRPSWMRRGVGSKSSSYHPLTLSKSPGQGGVLANTQLPGLPAALWAPPFCVTHIKKCTLPVWGVRGHEGPPCGQWLRPRSHAKNFAHPKNFGNLNSQKFSAVTLVFHNSFFC